MDTPIETIEPVLRAKTSGTGLWGKGVILATFTSVFGFVAAGFSAAQAGDSVSNLLFVAGGLGGAILGMGLFVGGSLLRITNTQYTFYDDRLIVDGLFGTTDVPYDDVAFAVRMHTDGDTEVGTASFELVREYYKNPRLEHCPDPDRVERLLNRVLPPATAWLEGRDYDNAIQDLLRRWMRHHGDSEDRRDDHSESAPRVIDDAFFEDETDVSPAGANLERLGRTDDVRTFARREKSSSNTGP